MRALCVVGARPNFVKIKPVVDALERRGVDVVLVHTGQHYDRAMSQVFFEELGVRPQTGRSKSVPAGTPSRRPT